MTDALSTFQPKSGLYLKFNDGDEVKLRVLTLDPVVSEKTFEDKETGEVNVSTKYAFVVWNWNEDRPQVLEVGPGILNKFVKLHRDEDLPPLNKADIKVSATGERLGRRYDVVVLPTTKEFTNDMIKQATEIKLEEAIKESKGRLSQLEDESSDKSKDDQSGYDQAKEQRENLKANMDKTLGETETVDLNEEMPQDFLL